MEYMYIYIYIYKDKVHTHEHKISLIHKSLCLEVVLHNCEKLKPSVLLFGGIMILSAMVENLGLDL